MDPGVHRGGQEGGNSGTADLLTYIDDQTAERCATTSRPPRTRDDWRAKRACIDAILDDAGGVVTRVGDETVGEMWSLFDGQDDPVGQLALLWQLWQPQAESYVRRALHPSG